ncbi:MAG: 4Fe-4S binding protein [Pseudomonadota bacterium]|nr:4Fe-4S binding protein [Pseudomonadota bacterium]
MSVNSPSLDSALSLPGGSKNGEARATALAASTLADLHPTRVISYRSQGNLLIVGPRSAVLGAAKGLSDRIHCILLVTDTSLDERDAVPRAGNRTVLAGAPESISGHLGRFSVLVKGPDRPIGLHELTASPRPYVDLVLDLSEPPAIASERKPPGYFAPGRDQAVLAQALAAIPELGGELEKPEYVLYDPEICAHGRSGIQGCTRCLDSCPSDAIRSVGDWVEVDPYLCQGVGSCATACPTGAMRYAYPRLEDLLERLRILMRVYREAGGESPSLLFHDGGEARARLERIVERIPDSVIPLEVEEIGNLGMDVWLAALAYGAGRVVLLGAPTVDRSAVAEIGRQVSYARTLLEGMGYPGGALSYVEQAGDEPLVDILAATEDCIRLEPASFAAMDEKRTVIHLALDHLHREAPKPRPLAILPDGAPFGEVWLNAERCTLCMACVSQCPGKALQAGDESPQLRFIEDNCVQCGLCARSCPENAIGPSPRYLFDGVQRRRVRVLKEEEPFLCIRCGKPFATQSVIQRILGQLQGHPGVGPEEMRRLRMCEDCRVKAMFETERPESAAASQEAP